MIKVIDKTKLKKVLIDALDTLKDGVLLKDYKLGDTCKAHKCRCFAKNIISDIVIKDYIDNDYVDLIYHRIEDWQNKHWSRPVTTIVKESGKWEAMTDPQRESFCVAYLKERGYVGNLNKVSTLVI